MCECEVSFKKKSRSTGENPGFRFPVQKRQRQTARLLSSLGRGTAGSVDGSAVEGKWILRIVFISTAASHLFWACGADEEGSLLRAMHLIVDGEMVPSADVIRKVWAREHNKSEIDVSVKFASPDSFMVDFFASGQRNRCLINFECYSIS